MHVLIAASQARPTDWGLRDYNVDGQIGLESTLGEYIVRLTDVFREVRRVLKPDGSLWLNLGDSYNSTPCHNGKSFRRDRAKVTPRKHILNDLKPKDLIGQPWRLAFALQADGYYLRSDIIWAKPNPMPESCSDRPTKSHEYLFLMSKNSRYFYDANAVREAHKEPERWLKEKTDNYGGSRIPGNEKEKYITGWKKPSKEAGNPAGRNKRTVWEIATQPMPDAHFATFPEKLVEPCILAGTSGRGYCGECGMPWVRVMEKPQGGSTGKSWHDHSHDQDGNAKSASSNGYKPGITTNWKPSCSCNAETVPGLVLDPFMGSGTVALVAHRLDRDFIGFELSKEYCEIAQGRIAAEVDQGRLFVEEN